MTQRSASVLSNFTMKERQAWDHFSQLMESDFAEDDLARLSWATMRQLVAHCGIHHPLDVALVELSWRERNQIVEEDDARTKKEEQEAASPRIEMSIQTEAPVEVVTTKTGLRKKVVGTTVGGRVPLSQRGVAKPAGHTDPYAKPTLAGSSTLKKSATATSSVAKPALKSSVVKPAAAASSTAPVKKAASPTNPVAAARAAARAPSPTGKAASPTAKSPLRLKKAPTKSPAPVAPVVEEEPEIEEEPTPSPIRRAASIVCIEDMRNFFVNWATLAGGDEHNLDVSRFKRLCKACGFIDKHFLLSDAERVYKMCALADSTTKDGVCLPYYVFRNKVVPEMASKMHTTITRIIKICNDAGGPRKNSLNKRTVVYGAE
jgi:hypothetical protein